MADEPAAREVADAAARAHASPRMFAIERRGAGEPTGWYRGLAVVIGLTLSVVYLAAQPNVGADVFNTVWSSTFGNSLGISQLIELATPLILAGCAACVVQRVRLWNIGIQGQAVFGAWFATLVAFELPGLSSGLLVPAMALAGVFGGCLAMAIPALVRVYLHVNEVLTTLMFNFIAALFVAYWATGPWRDTTETSGGALFSRPISENATFPHFNVGDVSISLAFVGVIVVVALVWAILRYSLYGYRTTVTGGGERTAEYAGINSRRIFLSVFLLSGGLGGLMGVVLLIDQVNSFSSALVTGNEGYIGIVVALIAGNAILGTVPAGLLMAFVAAAGASLQIAGVSPSVVLFVTGVLLLVASTGEALSRYRLRVDIRSRSSNTSAKTGV